jgi:N-acetylmuramoyl-L-alanine amidase
MRHFVIVTRRFALRPLLMVILGLPLAAAGFPSPGLDLPGALNQPMLDQPMVHDLLHSFGWMERRFYWPSEILPEADVPVEVAAPANLPAPANFPAPIDAPQPTVPAVHILAHDLLQAFGWTARPFCWPAEVLVPAIPPVDSPPVPAPIEQALLPSFHIVIDAGHGGNDLGAVGPHGLMEKDVVLDIALRVARLLQEGLNATTELTRSGDQYLTLAHRIRLANRHQADLFLSIHANSSPSTTAAGTETYFFDAPNTTMNSGTLARVVESSIAALSTQSNRSALDRGVKRAPFIVLTGASMPAVLAEVGFISNADEEANLRTPEYRQSIAESLYTGLARYIKSINYQSSLYKAGPDAASE